MSAVMDNWLDSETTGMAQASNCSSATAVGAALTTTNCYQQFPSSSRYVSYYPYVSPARPIRLSMAEVERLRKAAKADDALKAILKKFTAQIEVVVEF